MKKRVVFLSVLIILLLSIVLIRMNYTGFFILLGKQIEIIRLIEANESENLTYVKIAVVSSENVIAIQENLSCPVLTYSLNPEIDIFEFNENETTWVIANQSSSLNAELSYIIPINCTVLNGFYYILNENGTLEIYGIPSEENQTNQTEQPPVQNPPQPPSGSSGGGSGGGGGGGSSISRRNITARQNSSSTLITNQITRASDRQEYDELKKKAEEEVKKIVETRENPQVNRSYSPVFIILAIIALGIIIFFVISFTRKPR